MPNIAANVVVGVTGGVWYAPLGTALPTNATTALIAAYKEVGFLGESGIDEDQAVSNTKIKAFQNAAIVRVVQTEHSATIKFTMIESNPNSLALAYGNFTSVVGPPAVGQVTIAGAIRPHIVLVTEVIDGTKITRTVAGDAQVTELGTVKGANGAVVGYEVTLECFPGPGGVVKIDKYYSPTPV